MANCKNCGMEIPAYPECAGGTGFVSPLSDELPGSLKKAMVEGHVGIEGIERQVCIHCYADDFEQAYPGSTCHLREKADFIKEDPERAVRLGIVG